MATPRSEQKGYLYFIADEHGRVKVGWTADVLQRLTTLQVCNADLLTLVGAVPGTPDDERHVLRRLGAPIRGEWFPADRALAAMKDAGASVEVWQQHRRTLQEAAIALAGR